VLLLNECLLLLFISSSTQSGNFWITLVSLYHTDNCGTKFSVRKCIYVNIYVYVWTFLLRIHMNYFTKKFKILNTSSRNWLAVSEHRNEPLGSIKGGGSF
jgi:hypothetical protein